MVVPSAYIMKLTITLAFGKSSMYIMKSRGPMIDPCGAPVEMLNISDIPSLISTYFLRFCKYLLHTLILILRSLFHNYLVYIGEYCVLTFRKPLINIKRYWLGFHEYLRMWLFYQLVLMPPNIFSGVF